MVPNPDVEGRRQILDVHFQNVPKASDVNLQVSTPMTGSASPQRLIHWWPQSRVLQPGVFLLRDATTSLCSGDSAFHPWLQRC